MLPPLNTPIPHNGSPECPFCGGIAEDEMRTGAVVCTNCGSSAPRWQDWNRRIIARAPADRIAELEAALAGAEHDQIDLLFECRKYADAAETEGRKRMRTMRADAIERRLERTRATLKGKTDV